VLESRGVRRDAVVIESFGPLAWLLPVHKRMGGARARGPAARGRVCSTCALQQAQRLGDRLLYSLPAVGVLETTRSAVQGKAGAGSACPGKGLSATRCPGRHHTHMCMTGTGDTACCQIAATLQEPFRSRLRGCLGGWRRVDRASGTDRVRRRTSKGLITSGW
jgi:hypothetical protein